MQSARWIELDELAGRRADWRALVAGGDFASAFADPAWVLAWWHSYGEDFEPWAFVLEDGTGSLRGVALLALSRSSLARTLTFAGGSWNSLETLVCAPGAEAELSGALLGALAQRRSEWDVWRVQRLPRSSQLAGALLDGGAGLRASAHDIRLQPYLELPEDLDAFETRFGGKQQHTTQRKWRKLIKLGAVARTLNSPEEVESGLRALLDLRRERAIAQGQPHEHMDARFEQFLAEAVSGLLPDGVRLWTLELEGRTLATQLNLVAGQREHAYIRGLSEEHRNLSAGAALEQHAIHVAIEEGRSELDLGPGRGAYKYRLGAVDRELARMVVPSGSIRSRPVGALLAGDLRLRDTAAAEVLRRRRGLTPERATAELPVQRSPQRERPTSVSS